jgi:hypothetical protein
MALINSNLNATQEKDLLAPNKTLQAQGVGYDPEKRGVTTPETVQGQLDSILAKDSPLMQRAAAGGVAYANKRGLVNSTMGAQAAQSAMIDAAAPIANADAQTYNMAARENMAAGNTALQFGADSAGKAALLNTQNASDMAKLREQGSIERGLQQLKGEQATQLADIEASYKTLIQASDSAGKIYQQTMDAINKTLQSDLDPAAKNAAVTRQTELLRSGLAVVEKINAIPGLTSILNFSAVNA